MDDNSTMPFGKYSGEKLGDVPDNYLVWLWDQTWFTERSHGALWRYVRSAVVTVMGREE
ncbi:MAG: DUF3820 family protein [bacterium]